ncbi:MAG: TonB family protein, partial [Bryobacterales bacterium]|nr:TonB family protein [Bryobacterales bacterium]
DAAASVAAELGIRRPVKVLVSDGSASPMTWGILRPVILLPKTWQTWTADRLRVVLVHELGHVKRWDSLSQMLAACAAALYWPHPLIWLVAQRMRQQQEKACDDLVLNCGYPAPNYAEHLIGIASGAGKPPAPAIAMAQPSSLESRIVAALDPNRSRRSPHRTLAIAAGVLLAGLALTGAGARLMGQAGGSRLDGSVLDPSGAAVPGAEITVSFEGGNRKEITRSGADGTYSFASLPTGVYTIEVRARGFAVLSMPQVRLQDNQPRTLPLRLDVGRISETIQVVGKKPEAAPQAARTPQRIRVGGSVQATKLLRMVKPPYPEELQQAGVEGTVLLRGVISTSGKLLSLESMNSLVDARLTKTAIDAVSQWEYQPTLLNGQPVEVITTITVNFQLAP